MRKSILFIILLVVMSCSTDDINENECNKINQKYIELIGKTTDAKKIKDLHTEWAMRLKNEGCYE